MGQRNCANKLSNNLLKGIILISSGIYTIRICVKNGKCESKKCSAD